VDLLPDLNVIAPALPKLVWATTSQPSISALPQPLCS
jgi:hypothetical protein